MNTMKTIPNTGSYKKNAREPFTKGLYFIDTDIENMRAHTSQILHTVVAMNKYVPMEIVGPKFHDTVNEALLKERHNLMALPSMSFLNTFGRRTPDVLTSVLFNISAIIFLFTRRVCGERDFIYVRSSIFLPLVIFAYTLRVPCFYERHRKPVTRGDGSRDLIICKLASGIIVISNYMLAYYSRFKKRMLVAHDAVSLDRFGGVSDNNETRKTYGLASDRPVCLYAGTVSKLKGAQYVFAAAESLPQVTFLFVGSVSHEFSDAKLPQNVRLLGDKEQKELPSILQAADVLLLPHPKGEFSQSPMKLFEYMASRVPIVASRLPSISEVLNNDNAVLIEPESPEALVSGIDRVLNDPHLSKRIAAKAYEDVKKYTWDIRGKRIADFILNKEKLYEGSDA